MATTYEWKLEFLDENGSLVDDCFFPELDLPFAISVMEDRKGEFPKIDLALVMCANDKYGYALDMQHAYIEDGELPKAFEFGARIPAKFRRMLKHVS